MGIKDMFQRLDSGVNLAAEQFGGAAIGKHNEPGCGIGPPGKAKLVQFEGKVEMVPLGEDVGEVNNEP